MLLDLRVSTGLSLLCSEKILLVRNSSTNRPHTAEKLWALFLFYTKCERNILRANCRAGIKVNSREVWWSNVAFVCNARECNAQREAQRDPLCSLRFMLDNVILTSDIDNAGLEANFCTLFELRL